MSDYGIKIAKDGFDATDFPTEKTKKNFIILDTTEAHKLFYKGFVTGGSYTHNLGYKPVFFAFSVDSITSPTYFSVDTNATATTTEITNLPTNAYLIIFYEGV